MKSRRIHQAIFVSVAVLCSGIWSGPGCDSKDPGNALGRADVSKPLDGSPPTKPGQLVGAWFCISEDGDFEGIEFLKDGKALMSHGPGIASTVDYSVLEGGRVSLAAQGGVTMILDAMLSGDQLDLKGQQSLLMRGGTQRFRRLKSGETIADAKKEQLAARAKAYKERVAALEAFLKQPGLVLACAETGPGAPPSIALEVQFLSGSFSGKAWHDDRPPHLNAINGQLQLNEASNLAQLGITYGPRIAPPAAQPDGGGQITMNVAGEGSSLNINAKVTYGGGKTYELALRSDPKQHAEIVKRYEAELARIEALKQPIIQALKEYALLRGRLQPADPRMTEPETTELTLARDPKSGQYFCEGYSIGLRERGDLVSQAAAVIIILNDKAWLRMVCPPNREYMLSLPEEKSPKLSGQWMPVGSNQGRRAEFDIAEALDAAGRDARFEARRKALRGIPADSVFTGLAFEDSGFGLEMPIAFRLQISVNAEGAVSGKAEYPTLYTLMTVAGKVAESQFGPSLQLGYTAADSTPGDKIFFRSIQGGAWRLLPVAGEGPLKLAGFFTGPPLRSTVLTQVQDGSTAQLRKKLDETIGSGGQLYVAKYVGWQVPGVQPTVVEWKLDGATGKISGRMVVNGRALGIGEKSVPAYDGQVRQDNGWTVLDVLQVTPYHAYDRAVSAIRLFAAEDRAGVLHLNGFIAGLGTIPNDKPLPETPPKFDRCIDLVPVASVDPVTRVAIDKSIADMTQAKAAADSAAKAAQTAAQDDRRAKLAPFFPMFQSKTGLVITTDAPAELGAVILASQVDEQNAAITGKGLFLREMPFREFTFESGLDNWANLTITTSLSKTAYAFAAPKENVAAGRGVALKLLTDADRARLDALINLGQRLQTAPQAVLTVEILDAAGAKAREAKLAAVDLPGVSLYKDRKNDQVAAMFTVKSNGRYRWAKEPVLFRLNEPMKGKALYIKNGGATDNLIVIINGVHRASIPAIAAQGAASIQLPPDLEILDLRLEAAGTAQARGVVLVR